MNNWKRIKFPEPLQTFSLEGMASQAISVDNRAFLVLMKFFDRDGNEVSIDSVDAEFSYKANSLYRYLEVNEGVHNRYSTKIVELSVPVDLVAVKLFPWRTIADSSALSQTLVNGFVAEGVGYRTGRTWIKKLV